MTEDYVVDAVIKRSARAALIAVTAVVLAVLQQHFVLAWWKIGIAFGLMATTKGTYLMALFGLAFLFALVVIPPELSKSAWGAIAAR